jgi:homoserine acetyltransferase
VRRLLIATSIAVLTVLSGDASARWGNGKARRLLDLGKRVASLKEPKTPNSSVPALAARKQHALIKDFRLGGSYERATKGGVQIRNDREIKNGGVGGVTLESLGVREGLKLSYITAGTPRRNRRGKIINAVVVSSHYSGDSADLYTKWHGSVIGSGKLINTDKYFVVFLDALGLWGTSKPSGGLGKRFPRYNAWDYTQANYRLLRDHIGVDRVQLALGPSLGAFQSYMMAILHPRFVDAILPIGGSTTLKEASDVRGLFRTMTSTIDLARRSSPILRMTGGKHLRLFGREVRPLNRRVTAANEDALARGFGVLMPTAFAGGHWHDKSWATGQELVYSPDKSGSTGKLLRAKASGNNPLDFLFRNAAGETYHVRPHLDRIKAKTLILHVDNDKWLNVTYAREAAQKIRGARLLTRSHPLAHYGIFDLLNKQHLGREVASWMREIGMQPGAPE